MQRTSGLAGRRGWLPVLRSAAAIRAGMSPGGRNAGSFGSTVGPPAGSVAAPASRRSRSAGSPASAHVRMRFLQEPQAHHVAQEADRAVHAALVREVRRAAGVRRRPARRARRPRGPTSRTRCRRSDRRLAGTPTTAEAVSCEPTWITGVAAGRPVASATSPRSGPSRSPGSDRSANRRRGSPSASMMSHAHVADVASSRPVVEAFVRSAAGRPVSQVPTRSGMRTIVAASAIEVFGLGRELVERVERQELQARPRVQAVRRHDRVDALDAARGPLVAVVERLGDELAAGIEQPVIDAPCVDADAGQARRPRTRHGAVLRGSRAGGRRHPSAAPRSTLTGPFGKR